MRARVLIVDGNTPESTERVMALGGKAYGEGYRQALHFFAPDLDCTIIAPARANAPALPPDVELESYHGVAWTGSALSAFWDKPGVRRQIELAQRVYASGVPSFGSCWGLQVMCQALGGEVRTNPKGVEIGIARRIELTDAGEKHPLFEGKPRVFDAVTVHKDEVVRLPENTTVLAGNEISAVQAVEIKGKNGGDFWGVQYHPEYDLAAIGVLLRRDAARLTELGLFNNEGDVDTLVRDYTALQADPQGRKDLAWRYGLNAFVLEPARRMAELGNWLKTKVLPRAG